MKSNPKLPRSAWQFEAIGTQWSIETVGELAPRVKKVVANCIDDFDQAYSRFRADSVVTQVSQKAGTYEFPADVIDLLALYRALYDATDGAVTPLVGDSLSALGYDKDYSLKNTGSVKAPVWDEVMRWQRRTLTTTQPVLLDFGAAGKGYLVDKVTGLLEREGVHDYVIDASGDIRHQGVDKQMIGLENPHDPSLVIGVAELQNASLCGSATNRRSWGKDLHHVIDGRTGEPTQNIVATWAVAASTALADGLATALFFAGAEQLQTVGDFEFVRLHHDGHIEHSAGFVGELFV